MGGVPVILVVEDEWLLRDCIAAHLRAARLRVLEARSGEAAIFLLKVGQRVDVVFTDIRLAGVLNGWDVAVRFRKMLPEIPIIYTSGTEHEPKLAVPKSLFFTKPYEPATIAHACHECLNGGESRC
jgi:CheY-like chemotaxis protein